MMYTPTSFEANIRGKKSSNVTATNSKKKLLLEIYMCHKCMFNTPLILTNYYLYHKLLNYCYNKNICKTLVFDYLIGTSSLCKQILEPVRFCNR